MAEHTPAEFFAALFKNVTDGSINVRYKIEDGPINNLFTTPTQILTAKFPPTKHCWFGIATRNGSGRKEHIKQIPALWCDVDFKDIPEDKARDGILAFEPQPSAIIASGGGFHLYWFLKEALGKEHIEDVESIHAGIVEKLHGDTNAMEASHLLRIPGTFNFKYSPPRLAKVLQLRGDYYSFNSFFSFKQSRARTHTRVAQGVPELINFNKGTRDKSMFHLANQLAKSGTPYEEIQEYLRLAAVKWCEPAFKENELQAKIKSALDRVERRERNITQEIREWVLTSSGFFLTSDCFRELGLTSRDFQKAGTLALLKLAKEGVLERHGQRRGQYRRIEKQIVEQEWWEDDGEPLGLKWPLGIHEFARLYPGNVALLEGQKSQGKSAFAIEFCRLNYHLFDGKTLYQNVEMSQSEIKERFDSYGELFPFEEAKRAILFTKVHEAWWDRIQPNGLNVVDYLVEYEKAYMLADFVWKIHQKLDKGIALVLVQRDPFKPYPKGGLGVRDIPRLIISLLHHQLKLEDVKSFNKTEWGNPTGLAVKYKHVNYCQFKYDSDWFRAEEEKYNFTDRKSTEVKYVNGSH